MGRCQSRTGIQVALLTGGDDKSYALGLTSALTTRGIYLDFIGSDKVDSPELHNTPLVNFLNLRGDQRENVSVVKKILRILVYYGRLVRYAATAKPRIFHILWNNKFELIDRVPLMIYYRLLGKKIVLTAHNVNARKRDGKDNFLNRVTLRIQYALAHHIFLHTEKMRRELLEDFGIPAGKATVIPFGINNTLPVTGMTTGEAKRRLGFQSGEKVMLFFGQIAPYKGLEHLVAAFPELSKKNMDLRIVIAGKVKKGHEDYWAKIQSVINTNGNATKVLQRIEHIPDEDVEVYFKAADVLVLPYNQIFQSGVPFLAYNFGLPVIATDVGSLREDILEGKTGYICKPQDPADLAERVKIFFESELFRQLERYRIEIQKFANDRYSWSRVAEITEMVYARLLDGRQGSC
jgi:glycosyltransferase involved in cell wall biosynthesis